MAIPERPRSDGPKPNPIVALIKNATIPEIINPQNPHLSHLNRATAHTILNTAPMLNATNTQ